MAIYGFCVLMVVAGMLVLSFLLGQRHSDRATGEPYESGILATGSARVRFDVPFYLVALFFVIFDLEAVFLFAWAVAVRETGWPGFVEALVFTAILLAALVYLWRIGALDWAPRGRRTPPAPLGGGALSAAVKQPAVSGTSRSSEPGVTKDPPR